MKILVDADACPVKHIIEKIARKYQLEVFMLIDTSHILESEYSTVITVSQGADAVDFELMNRTHSGDIVITGDYGVATMVLGKGAYVMSPSGQEYTNDNIDLLMFQRHISKVQRRAGMRTKHIKKRTKEDDQRFEVKFEQLCKQCIS